MWILLLLVFVVSWGFCVKQARDWKYSRSSKLMFMDLFSGVGNWFLWLFEIWLNLVDPVIYEGELVWNPKNDSVNPNTEKSDIEQDLENQNKEQDNKN